MVDRATSIVAAVALVTVVVPMAISQGGSSTGEIRLSTPGVRTEAWATNLEQPGWSRGADVVVAGDEDRVVAAGSHSRMSTQASDFTLIGYETTGGEIAWVERPFDGDRVGGASGLAVTPAGDRAFAAGAVAPENQTVGVALASVDVDDGRVLWTARSLEEEPRVGKDVGFSPVHDLVVVVGLDDPPVSDHLLVQAYEADTGALAWSQVLTDPPADVSSQPRIAMGPWGDVVYVGAGFHGGTSRVMAFDVASGDRQWSQPLEAGLEPFKYVADLAAGPHGASVFAIGATSPGMGVVALDAETGGQQWARLVGEEDGAVGHAIAVDPFARVVVAAGEIGASVAGEIGASGSEGLVVAFDATSGATTWSTHIDRPGSPDDEMQDVAVVPSGERVIVSGEASGSRSTHGVITASFDTETGQLAWRSLHTEQTRWMWALALGPSSDTVVVTGQGERGWQTIAYPLGDLAPTP